MSSDALKVECPVVGCGYNHNMRVLEEAQESQLILESTRSHEDEDAHRDMDDFDPDEELKRLRRAVHEVRGMQCGPHYCPWEVDAEVPHTRVCALLAFITEAFDNIDERLVREGPLPRAWQPSPPDAPPPGRCGQRVALEFDMPMESEEGTDGL